MLRVSLVGGGEGVDGLRLESPWCLGALFARLLFGVVVLLGCLALAVSVPSGIASGVVDSTGSTSEIRPAKRGLSYTSLCLV